MQSMDGFPDRQMFSCWKTQKGGRYEKQRDIDNFETEKFEKS